MTELHSPITFPAIYHIILSILSAKDPTPLLILCSSLSCLMYFYSAKAFLEVFYIYRPLLFVSIVLYYIFSLLKMARCLFCHFLFRKVCQMQLPQAHYALYFPAGKLDFLLLRLNNPAFKPFIAFCIQHIKNPSKTVSPTLDVVTTESDLKPYR